MKENKSFVSNQQLVNKVNQKQENGKKQWLLGSFRAKRIIKSDILLEILVTTSGRSHQI